MSREIKFRAWNAYAKTMYEVDLLHLRNRNNKIPALDGQYMSVVYQPKVVLMQYTGLKDKNGGEIYEGDIVEIQQPTSIEHGAISFREGAFAFTSQVQVDGNRTIVFLHSVRFQNNWKLEVIGNIYENPELLTNNTPQGERS